MRIAEVVELILETGELSIEREAELRQLLQQKYDREDFLAFMALQNAAMAGTIKQASRSAQAEPA